jgi:2-C-methyl-D-erythritol 4-phosphate cytidylyltransferase/2-C-methyl-D-erythritol 2,4-cyclodiphosphate synthase
VAPSAPRVGLGFDAHAFAAPGSPAHGRPLALAGLEWPGERALEAHSDGDVVAHAIVDALASAAGLGDIGTLFGVDDPAAAGASGARFVGAARAALEAAGMRVGNVAVQVIGNSPKLAPRRAEAEAVLSALVGAPVAVAATTADGLGFTGRGEGIAAIATALVIPAGEDS